MTQTLKHRIDIAVLSTSLVDSNLAGLTLIPTVTPKQYAGPTTSHIASPCPTEAQTLSSALFDLLKCAVKAR
jgi:hypothetical protein